MRGQDEKQDAMFSYVAPERRVPADHPLRKIRALVDEVLREMSADRVEDLQQQRPQQPLRRNRWPARVRIVAKIRTVSGC